MKAARVFEAGGPEVLTYTDVDDPKPGPGEALVELKAVGINYRDVYERSGAYPVPLPFIPGNEGAGIVVEVGEGVTEVSVGDRVTYSATRFSYAEKVVAQAWRLIKMPDDMDIELGAASMLQGMTAHYLSQSVYPLKEGDTALVHSGAGGVGLLLIQMVKMRGARVITTVSTGEKAEIAMNAGADHAVLYTQQDFVEEVKRITDGKGVNVVYDAVGADTFDGGLEVLAPRGMMALYGQASGPVPTVTLSTLNPKSLFITRPGLNSYTATREELEARAGELLGWVQSGKLNVRVHGRFALQDASEAHRQLQGRLTTGKLLLIP